MSRSKKPKRNNSSSLSPLAASIFLFLIASVVYLNTLGHGFVIDDEALILQNRAVTEFRLTDLFSTTSYRPVRTLTYALNYALGGDAPFGYHLLNLILHGLNVLLLFRLLQAWGGTIIGSFIGSLIFALHPVQTAAVAYISGRKDLLATGFLLLAVLFYTRFRRSGGPRLLVASLSAGALAILSKEVALIFPALLILVEFFLLSRNRQGEVNLPGSRALKRLLPALMAAGVLAITGLIFVLYINPATRMTGYWGGNPWVNWATSLKLFAHYLKLIFWPHPLIADYSGNVFSLAEGFGDPQTLLGAGLLLGFLLVPVLLARTEPCIGLGMSWFLLALIPVLQWIPFHELAADHFLYLPLVGIALIVCRLSAFPVLSNSLAMRGGLVLVLLLFAWRTVDRNRDWRDSRTLWEATYASAPNSYRANANLGRIYFQDPELRARGIAMTERALELDPDEPVALSNFGIIQYFRAQAVASESPEKARQLARSARESLLAAVKANAGDGSVQINLGSVESLLGALSAAEGNAAQARQMRESAISRFQLALFMDHRPDIQAAWYNMALLQQEMGDYSKAAESLERFLESRPAHPEANFRLAVSYLRSGNVERSIPPLKRLEKLQPSARGFQLLASAQQSLGRQQEAISTCQRGLRLFPEDPYLKQLLGSLQATPRAH